MIETPQIVQTSAQNTAYIHVKVPRDQIQEVMGPGITELMSTVGAQGVSPVGPWFCRHLAMTPEHFDFEISVPVGGVVKAAGRVKPGVLRACTVARTVYQGGYEGLGDAWGEFTQWLEKSGHPQEADMWEVYLKGPDASEDPAQWRTQLNKPIKPKG